MSEETIVRARQNCCRLCLAPDDECVSIYGNLHISDKESISNKIHACVNIKVTKDDSLSTRICHICISYLNCWQSFKNRCINAQKKQEEWLVGANVTLQKEIRDLRVTHYNDSFNNGMNLSNERQKSIPVQIKEEPLDECEEQKLDEDESVRCDIDPTQFLATDVIEEEELKRLAANKNLTITKSGGENGPQILTSLGLQSIGNDNVNPFAFLSASLGASSENLNEFGSESKEKAPTSPGAPSQKPHDCRICKMKFSTRANARRHERNLHGLINDTSIPPLSISTTSNTVQSSTPKNIRRKSNPIPLTPEMMGIYEYDKPEKYRHMLTPQKLAFIEEFEEFLKQYQTLTCKCCSKLYPKYKNFMAHMRKKYPKLPRASCFKCLKQFESKAIFVSHVKRRNCINLYKLYTNDPTIEKYDKSDKMKAKELLVNKFYECKLCPKEFRLKLEFRNHVHEDHGEIIQKKESSPDTCVFCSLKIDDAIERKRHYNNMECILNIRCSTCNTKFENHQTFLDHVYKEHVPLQANNSKDSRPSSLLSDLKYLDDCEEKVESSPQKSNESTTSKEVESVPPVKTQFHSRMPQNCKICGARYNNYNNVLRHMEAKHPDQLPQTYKCSLCFVGFPRLSNLREHMWDVHNKKLAKPKRDAEIYCRICLEKFSDKDSWVNHQTEQHDRYICCICFSQYDDVLVFKEHIKIHTSLSYTRQQGTTQNSFNNPKDSAKYTGRFDYVMKDLMSITNGSGDNKDKNDLSVEEPPNKKLKLNDEFNQSNELSVSNKMEGDDKLKQKVKQSSFTNSNVNNDKKALTIKQSSLHECKICHSVFNSSQGLSNHMRAHNAQEMARRASLGLPPTKVETKSNGAENAQKFIKNNQVLALEHRFRRMRCRLCQKRFSSKKVYRRHMLVDHHVQNVQFIHCAICRAEFAHEKGLKVHMIKIHGKILKDIGAENLQYECDICSIVYKSEEELMSHKQSVHNLAINLSGTEEAKLVDNNANKHSGNVSQNNENIQFWFQCRYCASNFDSNKKLAIHINIHDEVDSSDYSCKDCGNVYSGRKSLWVHRYKKHPVLPSPSFCDTCNKMFFTKEHFEFHMQHLHKIPFNKIAAEQNNLVDSINSKEIGMNSEIHVEKKENHKEIIHVSGEDVQTVQVPVTQIPQVPCTVCQIKFSDEEAFSKHMKIHEESFYTDNPLAAMFDTEPEDPDQVLQKRINENGEFVCDICPKTFQQLTALKVHRNWHFRSDGKQTQADPNVWQSFAKKRKSSPSFVKCKYCSSTFSSSSDMKSHVLESHNEMLNKSQTLQKEKPLECKKCNLKFKTQDEWLDHKISDVKNDFSSNKQEWSCDICEKIFNRKDDLLQHIHSHRRDNESKIETLSKTLIKTENCDEKSDTEMDTHDLNDNMTLNENNMESILGNNVENLESKRVKEEDFSKEQTSDSSSSSDSDSETDDDEPDEDEEDNDYKYDTDDEVSDDDVNDVSGPHSCDLCQETFDNAEQLTSHVTTHFYEFEKLKTKLEHDDKVKEKSNSPIQKEVKTSNVENEVEVKLEKGSPEVQKDKNNIQYQSRNEYHLENNNEKPKQMQKLIINRKNLTIKKEFAEDPDEDDSRQTRESTDENFSDVEEEDDEDDDYDHKYVTSAQPITESLDESIVYSNDSNQDLSSNSEDVAEDDNDEEYMVKENINEQVIGEEIVHDDDAEYHENNITHLDSNADSNSALDHEKNEIIDESNLNLENYEHFMDDEEDGNENQFEDEN
ncbi:zinc finger protein hangover [Condylostylus longicornis]|uniref:zinc finger protein hangover n=1 Tax=Condylostylus longicornis TaxID=2530218 RepID=UPI00244DB70E|nr:zinc finger protein hangover [Condylostylus longicornis]